MRTNSHLPNKLHTFHATWKFITTYTTAHPQTTAFSNMRCKPIPEWGNTDNFSITLATDWYCHLQSNLLHSLYTGPSASPIAGRISRIPVPWCCPTLLVIQLESSHPQIFIPLTGFSSLGKGKVTMTSERKFLSFLAWSCRSLHKESQFSSWSSFSRKGTNFATISLMFNLLLKCVKRYQTIDPECYKHHKPSVLLDHLMHFFHTFISPTWWWATWMFTILKVWPLFKCEYL